MTRAAFINRFNNNINIGANNHAQCRSALTEVIFKSYCKEYGMRCLF